MFVDVSSVVVGFLDQSITVIRSQGRTFDQDTGFFTELSPIFLSRRVHIQPVTGRDMDKLRELHDVTEAVRVWSTEEFEIGKEGQTPFRYNVSVYQNAGAEYDEAEYGEEFGKSSDSDQKADQMIWKKRLYEIRPILRWEIGNYYEVVATL